MTQWRWIVLAASLALFAGCGGDEESQQSEADTKATAAEEAEQTAAREAEQAAAEESSPAEKPGWGDDRSGEMPAAAGLMNSALKGSHRAKGNAARDRYRHPAKTLKFFGLKPDMTVVELYPGGGWYTEVLAPTLRKHGKLIAAGFSEDSEVEYYRRSAKAFNQKLATHPAVYSEVEQIVFNPPDQVELGEPESADMVLTFRNLHNWHDRGALGAVFKAAHNVLKPGGVFGVVEHRAPEGVTIEDVKETGYMPEDYVVALAEETGFRLEASSDINANPDDTGDHPMGVWTLPPSMRYCEEMDDGAAKASCKEKYRKIGESDRMTLKFVKPATE